MAAVGRKDKQSLLEVDNHVKEVRQQFSEQVKCLDSRLENKIALVTDVQEFLRKRSEMELEYARNLERLADRFSDRFQKQRNTYGLSTKERAAPVNLWWKMLKDTKYKAKAAATLSDILSKNVAARFSDMNEDISRISRTVRDTVSSLQEEIMRSIHDLQQAMKVYYTKQSEYVFAQGKLKESESAKLKAERESPSKKGNEKRMKNIDRVKEKRQIRYNDSRIKATKARNDYILLLEATTSTLNKYYDHDIGDILSKSDHNYHNSFKCAFQAYCRSELHFANSVTSAADSLSRAIGIVDPDNDRLLFLEDNQHAFFPERKMWHFKHSEDKLSTITAVGAVKKELDKKHEYLYDKLQQLKSELAELGDVMVERSNKLNDIYRQYDTEMNAQHSIDIIHPPMPLLSQPPVHSMNPQIKINKEEAENGYLIKFKELIHLQRLSTSTQTKYDVLAIALGEISEDQRKQASLKDELGSPILVGSMKGKPIKLFGTTLDYQAQITGREMPEIVESCIRFISKFGLEHQGIFRVSGTSQEISDMKKSFEEGKDPLAGLNHWKDINAVAGVFRAYFRELEDPLFPSKFCNDYIRISRLQSVDEQIQEAQRIFSACPALNLHIIVYLFKFLNLISTKSDVNKMTSHNLAVVFGPTVIRAPANEDLITNQGQINIFVEFFITEFFNVFPNEKRLNEDGTKSVRSDDGDDENEDAVDDEGDEDLGSDEENDGDFLEAEAMYDYCARSHKELSFKKGDIIQVFSRANKDWWDAKVDGSFGFVPANYVKVASPESERLDTSVEDGSTGGATEVPTKADSSSEEPLLLEEKLLTPRSDSDHSPLETPRTESRDPGNNFFATIDPTASKTGGKCATLGGKAGGLLTGPQPFQNRGTSLPRHAIKSESDSMMTDSLSSTVTAVREAFGGPRQLKPAVSKSIAISATDLRNTQSKLRPGTPEDALATSESAPAFEERSNSMERGGSVKNISQMFNRQGSGNLYRKQVTLSTTSDESAPSPTSEEGKRHSSTSSADDHDREHRPPAPAVKPKPLVKRDSGVTAVHGGGLTGQSELIASIKAAAVAKVVKEATSSIKEETNL